MGGIDLDPASCAAANARVGASNFYTEAEDGLSRPWFGRVWVNHPFGRKTNAPWIAKILAEFSSGRVGALCCITFAATSEQWFSPLLFVPQCFLIPRTNYHGADGQIVRGVSKGSVVSYFGHDVEAFKREFARLGVIKVVA